MPVFQDIAGQRFGRLVVVALHSPPKTGQKSKWLCYCECGAQKVIDVTSLKSGHTKSCGCLDRERRVKHGHVGTAVYTCWQAMWQRCVNPKCPNYRYYGARGIAVCDRWRDFEHFRADMGERPDGHAIDRVDPDGNYEPGNCRWLPSDENAQRARHRPKAARTTAGNTTPAP